MLEIIILVLIVINFTTIDRKYSSAIIILSLLGMLLSFILIIWFGWLVLIDSAIYLIFTCIGCASGIN